MRANPFKHQKPIPGNISGHAQPKVDILRLGPASARWWLARKPVADVIDRDSLPAGTVETRRAFAAQVLRGFAHDNRMDQATAQPAEAATPE